MRNGTLRKQFEAFSEGRYMDTDGNESTAIIFMIGSARTHH